MSEPNAESVHWTEMRDLVTGRVEVRISLPEEALCNRLLDGFDLRLLRECEGADATLSDRLLALEIIVRRWEQRVRNNGPES